VHRSENGLAHPNSDGRADLAIVIISTNEAHWLGPCLSTVFEHAGSATLEVVVVENECTDDTRALVESSFPDARVVSSPNRGFGYGKAVLRGVQQAASQVQCPVVVVVWHNNPGAKRIYLELGFQVEESELMADRMVWYPGKPSLP